MRRGPALLAWAIEGHQDRVVLSLKGDLDWRAGPVLEAAWQAIDTFRPCRVALDLKGIRRWDAGGLARLLEFGAGRPIVAVYGATPRLQACLAATRVGWGSVADRLECDPCADGPETDWYAQGLAPAQLLDIALALLALVVLAPLLLCIMAAIRLDSPGPALFTQLRSGGARPDGSIRVFRVFKFRTMVDGADALRISLREATPDGPFFKLKGDPRITRVGRLLRAWSLDELPQLLNVVRGEMRLVGNRPLPLDEAELLREPWQRARFRAPAGITGLWQVSARSDCTPRARLALDTAYAATRSPWLDFRILLATVPAIFRRKGW